MSDRKYTAAAAAADAVAAAQGYSFSERELKVLKIYRCGREREMRIVFLLVVRFGTNEFLTQFPFAL